MKMTDVSKERGASWRGLSEDEQGEYKLKAEAINAKAGLGAAKEREEQLEEQLDEEPAEKPKKGAKKPATKAKEDSGKKPFSVYCDKHRAAVKKKHPKATKDEITGLLEEAFKGLSKNELRKYKAC
jgi:hypothetical protein